VRLVVPNLPDASFAPVPEQGERAGTQASASSLAAADSSATSSAMVSGTSPSGTGMAIAGINCSGGNAGSLQVLAGA
jgi:hypothetical protein